MSYQDTHYNFRVKYQIAFSIDEYQKHRRGANKLSNFALREEIDLDAANLYMDTLTAALKAYLEERTSENSEKKYDFSDLDVAEFIDAFENVMQEKHMEEIGVGVESNRKPYENIPHAIIIDTLKDRLKQYDASLDNVWAHNIVNNVISIKDFSYHVNRSIEYLRNFSAESLNGEIPMMNLTNVLLAHRAMVKVTSERSPLWKLWIGNWLQAYRESKLMSTLNETIQDYEARKFPIDKVLSDNNKSVLSNSEKSMQKFINKPLEKELRAKVNRQLSEEMVEKEAAMVKLFSIKEEKAPENIPEGKRMVDKNLFKVGYIPKPDTMEKDYEELKKVQDYLNTFKSTGVVSDYISESGETMSYLDYQLMNLIVKNNLEKIDDVRILDPEKQVKKFNDMLNQKTSDNWFMKNNEVINSINFLREERAQHLMNLELDKAKEEIAEYQPTAEQIEMVEQGYIDALLEKHGLDSFSEDTLKYYKDDLAESNYAVNYIRDFLTQQAEINLTEKMNKEDPQFFEDFEIKNIFLPDENAKDLNEVRSSISINNEELNQGDNEIAPMVVNSGNALNKSEIFSK